MRFYQMGISVKEKMVKDEHFDTFVFVFWHFLADETVSF